MNITKKISWALAFSALMAAAPMSANADRHDDGRRDGGRHDHGRNWHGDIRVFHARDFPRWRAGHWRHGRHEGRLGWWWVVAGVWYFYPQPVYPYPDPYTPPVVVIQQTTPPAQPPASGPGALSPQAQNWYYCESAKSYYPYVPSCPEGWKMVPATPPGVPAQ